MGSLSTHFSLSDVTRSQEAARRGIDNDLPIALVETVRETVEMMERIRAFLTDKAGHQCPVIVSSWYRSIALNRAIGSSDTSDHIRGCAVDFEVPSFGNSYCVAAALAPHVDALRIGQLINEFPDFGAGWVHVSTRMPSKLVNRIITIKRSGTHVGVIK